MRASDHVLSLASNLNDRGNHLLEADIAIMVDIKSVKDLLSLLLTFLAKDCDIVLGVRSFDKRGPDLANECFGRCLHFKRFNDNGMSCGSEICWPVVLLAMFPNAYGTFLPTYPRPPRTFAAALGF